MNVWLHLAMCRHCRRFLGQVRAIDRAVKGVVGGLGQDKPADLEERVVTRVVDREDVG